MNHLFLLDQAAGAGGGASLLPMLGAWAVIIVVFWFFLIRPQRKAQKQTEEMQSSVEIGNEVLTNGGLYGVVVDKVNDIYIVEFGRNKSVRVPVQKTAIAAIKSPDLSVNKEEEASE